EGIDGRAPTVWSCVTPIALVVEHSFCFFFSSRRRHTRSVSAFLLNRSSDLIFLMSRKIILIKQELLLLVYELNRSGLLAENEKIRPILAQLEKLLLCDLSPSTNDSVKN